MDRGEAINMVKKEVPTRNLVNHMVSVGAIMKGIARKLGENEELWEITGILHDIDYEKTKEDFKEHSLLSAKMLEGKIPEEAIKAIKSHNFENTRVMPSSNMDWALICSDALSGLIVACALVMPEKKISQIKLESVEKKFESKDFARNVKRENIDFCEKIGINRNTLFELGLEEMNRIAKEIGL